MMDIEGKLPENFEWYKDQIAGHNPSIVRDGLRQIGILKEKGSDRILKLVQEGIRGERELNLYERVSSLPAIVSQESELEKILCELQKILPRYFGCRKISLPERGNHLREWSFIELEDITSAFCLPCIMDVKIGRVTYDPFASEEKKQAESSKAPMQYLLGFRILGYRIHTKDGIVMKDRVWGRERNMDDIQDAFEEYFYPLSSSCGSKIVDLFMERLENVFNWFDRQEKLHFYASSILFVYEGCDCRINKNCSRHGDEKKINRVGPKVDLRLIDFSHVVNVDSGKDENYLYGLNTVREIFGRIKDKYEKTRLILV